MTSMYEGRPVPTRAAHPQQTMKENPVTTSQLAIPGAPDATDTAPRFRPWHYMLVTQFIDTDDDGEDLEPEYSGEGYDDLARVREAADAGWCGAEAGVWDNWAGVWVVEPDWSDEVEMTAEGSAPYSARPEAAAA